MKTVGESGVPFTGQTARPAAKRQKLDAPHPEKIREQSVAEFDRGVAQRQGARHGVRSSTDANHSYDDASSNPAVMSHSDTSTPPATGTSLAVPAPRNFRSTRPPGARAQPLWPSQKAAARSSTVRFPSVVWHTTLPDPMPSGLVESHEVRLQRERDTLVQVHANEMALFGMEELGPAYKSDPIARPPASSMNSLTENLFFRVNDRIGRFQLKYLSQDRLRIQAVVTHVIAWQLLGFNERTMNNDNVGERGLSRADYNSTLSIIDHLICSDYTIHEIEVAMASLSHRAPTVRLDDVIQAAVNARHMIFHRTRDLNEIKTLTEQIGVGTGATVDASKILATERLFKIISQNLTLPMIQVLHPPYLTFIHGEKSVGQAFKDMFGGDEISTDRVPDVVCDVAAAIGSGAIEALRRRENEAGHDAPSPEQETEAATEAVRKILNGYLNAHLLQSKPFGKVSHTDPRHLNVSCIHKFLRRVALERAESLAPYKKHFKTWCAGVLARGLERRAPPITTSSSGAV